MKNAPQFSPPKKLENPRLTVVRENSSLLSQECETIFEMEKHRTISMMWLIGVPRRVAFVVIGIKGLQEMMS